MVTMRQAIAVAPARAVSQVGGDPTRGRFVAPHAVASLLARTRATNLAVSPAGYSHPDWLGAPFVEEAEYLRDTNEQAWRWEYLGEITGTGGAVFDNVVDLHLSDDRIRNFEHIRNGVDWGWFPDPWRFVRCAWEPSARRLLIFEEHSANKTMPADTGKVAVDLLTFPDERGGEPYFHDRIVYCDDTPDSKVQMKVWRRELGIRVHAVRKTRMRRLSYECEIVIDPARCPLTFSEFTLKEFEKDREGNWIDEIPDGNNHSKCEASHFMWSFPLLGMRTV